MEGDWDGESRKEGMGHSGGTILWLRCVEVDIEMCREV